MSLLTHITTRDLLDVHADLLKDAFPNEYLQNGTDGVITNTTVPCTFLSSTLNLNHYVPDSEAETLDNDAQKVKLLTDNPEYKLPVLNIVGVGFFRITAITNNQTCTIDYMSPAEQLIINRGLNLDLDATTVSEGTGLRWSLGGKEEKIAIAYSDVITELIKRQAVTAKSLNDNDPTYIGAIRYRALQLVFMELTTTPEDSSASLSNYYYRMYQRELTSAKPYGYTKKAVTEWERS